ncbi:MAG: phosphotransferase family protein [Acidimicrobiia bacterium]|nr:phosphotransferase family protein [Acidimicrobiia bacterium]
MSQDTAPIRDDERFDEARVVEYLRRALPDLVGDEPIEFDQFPGGAANLTYRAVAGGTELVLRRAPHGPVAEASHDMEREHRVLSTLWSAYPKAPRSYHFCPDASVMGKPFFVMERRRGWVIRAEWPDVYAADPSLQRALAESLVDALAELHMVDTRSIGLSDFGRPAGFVQRQVAGWTRRWEAAKTREIAAMEQASRVLAAQQPRPGPTVLLHNDYKLDNTMVDDRGSLVAVFDWDMSTRGDALVDLGTLLAYWPDPDAATFPLFGAHSVMLAPVMGKDEVRHRYAATTGFDVNRVAFYEGLALFRIAVIIEQIYARYVKGQTADDRFSRFEPLVPILAASACEVLG